jgi:hypothetical protein
MTAKKIRPVISQGTANTELTSPSAAAIVVLHGGEKRKDAHWDALVRSRVRARASN